MKLSLKSTFKFTVLTTIIVMVTVSNILWRTEKLVGATVVSNSSSTSSSTQINYNVGPEKLTANVNVSDVGKPINEDVLGVNQLSAPQDVPLMKELGVQFARVDASLEGSFDSVNSYNCQTGVWSSALLSSRVKLVQSAGAQVQLIIDYSPKCLEQEINNQVPSNNYGPPDLGSDLPKWESLISQVGTWAIEHNIRYFEVWNEPDWQFFSGNVQQYNQLYQNTVIPLEKDAQKLNTKIYVGGPAMADVLDQIDSTFLTQFLNFVSANKLPLDFVSWHTYANDPNAGLASWAPNGFCLTNHVQTAKIPCYYTPQMSSAIYKTEVEQVKSILSKYPKYHPQLWLDEWNFDAESDPRMNTPYASAFLISAIEKATGAGVNVMEWYNTADSPNQNYQGSGLLNQSYQPKPSYLGFQLWHMMEGNVVKVVQHVTKANQYQHGSVYVTKSSGGNLNLLVNNYVSYDTSGNFGSSPTSANSLSSSIEINGLVAGSSYLEVTHTIGLTNRTSYVISSKKVVADGNGNLKLNLTSQEETTSMITLEPIKSQSLSGSSSNNTDWLTILLIVVIILIIVTLVLAIKRNKNVKAQNT